MGSIKPSLQGTTSAKQTERKMHLLALTTSACLLVKMYEAAVAVGVGRLNPENPSECLDPDTGLNHTLGVAWNIPGVCGQAHCELRNQQVYISYAFCGSAQAEAPCYLSSRWLLQHGTTPPRSALLLHRTLSLPIPRGKRAKIRKNNPGIRHSR